MATINKLAIMGIRSFNPDEEQVIKFQRPLTLIVGSNGAGKTTIIECIKMALTGQLPPDADKGKNFIHDPKVKSSNDTNASIRLQFTTAEKKKIETSRNFKLQYKTSKAKGVTKQALSYSVHNTTLTTVGSDGTRTAISFRTQDDVNQAIPGLMKISKAILENVIFVHQEDANWPLRESKVLKEKFDDIFAATRCPPTPPRTHPPTHLAPRPGPLLKHAHRCLTRVHTSVPSGTARRLKPSKN